MNALDDTLNFEEIRPYRDEEVPGVMQELTQDADFLNLCSYFYPDQSQEEIAARLRAMTTNLEFQSGVVYPAMQGVLAKTTSGFTSSGFDQLDPKQSYLFISNHRDIILDPALLNYTLYEHYSSTTEIAIGNNLLAAPWIEKLVKLNKSFIVHRNVQGRQSLVVSQRLSNYIRHSITGNHSSVWIAQKEGRTKDGNDKTQPSLLKMLYMSGEGPILDELEALNIVPVSLSYEYDPCDVMKLWELQPEFAEVTEEEDRKGDIQNMIMGIQGWKGHIHFAAGTPIHSELEPLRGIKNKNEQLQALASIIDQQIYQNYQLFPCNFIAYDRMHGQTFYADEQRYDAADVDEFDQYLAEREASATRPVSNIRESLLKMYAYPVENQLKAQ